MFLCSGSFIKTSSNLHPFKRQELSENKGYINEGHITHQAWRYYMTLQDITMDF